MRRLLGHGYVWGGKATYSMSKPRHGNGGEKEAPLVGCSEEDAGAAGCMLIMFTYGRLEPQLLQYDGG